MKKLALWLSVALIGVFALSSRPVATQSTSTNSIVLFADAYDLDSTTTIYCDTGATYPTGTVAACSTGSAAGDGWITVSGYGNVAVIVDVDAVDNNITVVVEARYRNASPVTTDTITIDDAFDIISAAGVQTFVLNIPADQIRVGVSVAAGVEGTNEDLEVIVYRSFNGLTAGLSSSGTSTASGSGTANTVVKFDASGDLADSQITDDGTTLDMTVADLQFTNNGTITSDVNMFINATFGGTGVMLISANRTQNIAVSPAANTDIYEWIQTLPITAAGQTTNVLKLELTNANHTGGTVNGFLIGAITGDAQATEAGISIESGWDVDILGVTTDLIMGAGADRLTLTENDGLEITGIATANLGSADATTLRLTADRNNDEIALILRGLGLGLDTYEFTGTTPANRDFIQASWIQSVTAAGQTGSGINLVVTEANHTGGTLNGFNLGTITGDADSTENAINIGTGWDYGLTLPDDIPISLGTDRDWTIEFDTDDGGLALLSPTAGLNGLIQFTRFVTASSGFLMSLTGTVGVADGGETIDGLVVNLTNANHTGTGNFFSHLKIAPGVGDANANMNGILIQALTGTVGAAGEIEAAINIASGWDTGILLDDNLTDYITFENGNGSFRNHASPGYYIMPNGVHQVGGDTNGSTLGGVANNVRVWREYIPYRLTVSRIVWSIETGGAAGAECSAGIYNADGTTLLINSGAQVCTGTGAYDIDVTDTTIGPGFYLFVVTADDATVVWEVDSDATPNAGKGAAYNATVVQVGDATNVSADAVLPATTGALVGANTRATAIVKLQG